MKSGTMEARMGTPARSEKLRANRKKFTDTTLVS